MGVPKKKFLKKNIKNTKKKNKTITFNLYKI